MIRRIELQGGAPENPFGLASYIPKAKRREIVWASFRKNFLRETFSPKNLLTAGGLTALFSILPRVLSRSFGIPFGIAVAIHTIYQVTKKWGEADAHESLYDQAYRLGIAVDPRYLLKGVEEKASALITLGATAT